MLGEGNYIDDVTLRNALGSNTSNPVQSAFARTAADINIDSEDEQDEDGKDQEDVVVRLFRAWLNEKATPDLLPFPRDVIFGIRQLLESQVN